MRKRTRLSVREERKRRWRREGMKRRRHKREWRGSGHDGRGMCRVVRAERRVMGCVKEGEVMRVLKRLWALKSGREKDGNEGEEKMEGREIRERKRGEEDPWRGKGVL